MSSDSDFDEVSRRKWEESRNRPPRSRTSRSAPPTERMPSEPHPHTAAPDDDRRDSSYNRDWRRERTVRTSRRTASPFSSPQAFYVWLQRGGWMIFAGVGVVLLLALIALLWQSGAERRANNPFAPDVTAIPGQTFPVGLPTVTPEPNAAGVPAGGDAPAALPAFVVVNTGGLGLRMRAAPGTNSAVIATLPDGARVEQIGEDSIGSDYSWRKVRAPSGEEGWVAVDFLQPTQ